MSMTIHERPGVYSSYDASTVINGSGGGSTVGLVGLVTDGESGKLYTFNRYEDAVTQFGQEENLTKLVQVLFRNGASRVVVAPVSGEEDYQGAFDLLAMEEDIDLVVCDSTKLSVQQALRQSVCDASQARRERIAVVGGAQSEDVEALVERAEGLNSERVVLVAPGDGTGLAAAAVAGAIAGENDPAIQALVAALQSDEVKAFMEETWPGAVVPMF